ncbi:MAG: nitroreductase family protein [Proteobacteria bacterium]|nr:nitroreductase family protein [Pseudomonadota bacterium]
MDTLEALTTRASPRQLVEPAPDEASLAKILAAAVAVPDHGRLRPWRFFVVRGEARQRFGDLLADALRKREPNAPQQMIDGERAKPLRAPLIIVVATKLQNHPKIPAVEQVIATGLAAQHLLLAAHALGFGGMWRTGAPAYDPVVKQGLGLAAEDSIIGFIYLGTPAGDPPPAKKLDHTASTVEWTAPATVGA